MGISLWLKSTRFNHFMSAFPFMDSFRGGDCPGPCKWATWLLNAVHLALGSDPQISKIFRGFIQLLCQKWFLFVFFFPTPNLKSAFSQHFYIWSVPDESALDYTFPYEPQWACVVHVCPVPAGQRSRPLVLRGDHGQSVCEGLMCYCVSVSWSLGFA